jgi:hypothetical protein
MASFAFVLVLALFLALTVHVSAQDLNCNLTNWYWNNTFWNETLWNATYNNYNWSTISGCVDGDYSFVDQYVCDYCNVCNANLCT